MLVLGVGGGVYAFEALALAIAAAAAAARGEAQAAAAAAWVGGGGEGGGGRRARPWLRSHIGKEQKKGVRAAFIDTYCAVCHWYLAKASRS